jgi:hypothetical protein
MAKKKPETTPAATPQHVYKIVPIDSLVPYENNPRTHSESQINQIRASIREFGFTNPVLSDESNKIIAGHGRQIAAKLEGMTELPSIEIRGLSDTQKRALVIADNQLALNAGWDDELLQKELQALVDAGYDVPIVGFSQAELDRILGVESLPAQPPVYSDEQILASAFKWFRGNGFPYPRLELHEMMQQLNALRASDAESLLRSTAGYRIADTFHPHRFDASVSGKKSPIEGFSDDKILRRNLAFSLKHAFLPAGPYAGLHLMSGVQEAANFRPGFAAYLYRRFCTAGASVLDTSTGYGGRLVGAIGSGVVASYQGVDPNTQTCEANAAMLAVLGVPMEVDLICKPAEDVLASELTLGPFDFAFTSPPYFSKEHYSDDDTQSWKRYPTSDGWRAGFLKPMLALQFAALKSGARAIINIEDVTIDDVVYPLVDWTRQDALAAGFILQGVEKFPLPASPWVQDDDAPDRFERVLIFKKP